MKKMPHWARGFQATKALLAIVFLGSITALPVGAQETVSSEYIPSVIPDAAFSPWLKMHRDSFEGNHDSAVRQCYESVGSVEGLSFLHCDILAEKLAHGECEVKWIPDGEKYRWMRGRVNNNPALASQLTPNLVKQLGRYDRALRCGLGDHIMVDWFTGVKGQSCNNLGFIYIPPPPTPTAKWVCREQKFSDVGSDMDDSLYLSSFYQHNCCCGGSQYTPSLYIKSINQNLQSNGESPTCGWE